MMETMQMSFSDKLPFTLLFRQWKVVDNRDLGAAIFGIFILTGLFEAVRAARERLCEMSKEPPCESNSTESISNATDSRASEIDNLVWHPPKKICTNKMKFHIVQSVFQMLQLAIGYVMMLSIMTYNTWIFVTLIISSGISFCLFNFLLMRVKTQKDEVVDV